MLRRKFELIPIKVEFFYKFLNLLKKSGQRPSTIIVQCVGPNVVKND